MQLRSFKVGRHVIVYTLNKKHFGEAGYPLSPAGRWSLVGRWGSTRHLHNTNGLKEVIDRPISMCQASTPCLLGIVLNESRCVHNVDDMHMRFTCRSSTVASSFVIWWTKWLKVTIFSLAIVRGWRIFPSLVLYFAQFGPMILLNGPTVIGSFYLYLVDGYNAANRFHVLTDVIPNPSPASSVLQNICGKCVDIFVPGVDLL